MLTQIVPGEIIVRKDGREYFLAVGEGFVEITGERVAIMTDMAIRAENIDEAKAEEARRRAEARLAEQLDDEEAAMVSAALAHSLAQLKVKRRQQHYEACLLARPDHDISVLGKNMESSVAQLPLSDKPMGVVRNQSKRHVVLAAGVIVGGRD